MATEERDDALVAALNAVRLPDPPADLKAKVLARIAARPKATPIRPLRRLVLPLVCASAAALLLVILASGTRAGRPHEVGPSPAQAAGTLAPQETAAWPLLSRSAALTIRRQGDRYAFFVAAGPGAPELRWEAGAWDLLSGGNPVVLRRRAGATEVGLWAGGTQVLRVPLPEK